MSGAQHNQNLECFVENMHKELHTRSLSGKTEIGPSKDDRNTPSKARDWFMCRNDASQGTRMCVRHFFAASTVAYAHFFSTLYNKEWNIPQNKNLHQAGQSFTWAWAFAAPRTIFFCFSQRARRLFLGYATATKIRMKGGYGYGYVYGYGGGKGLRYTHQSALGRIKTSLRVRISRQGTPNGVMLLPPEACVFSSYMCVFFYCLKY